MHPDRLLTTSLRAAPQGRALAEVMAAALEAADPAAAVRAHLRRDGAAIEVGDRRYEQAGRVLLVGGGKAAAPMAQAALAILGERVSAGVLVTKDGHAGGMQAGGATLPAGADQFGLQPSAFSLLEAGHPVPDARGAAATWCWC
jgi:hydroxypyruvate reductase